MSFKKTPVSIIGGYLGSGKTTLVNHLLRHCDDTKIAVLVNDFGELPIDADLIQSEVGNIISLSGGCVCCSYGNDLSMALIDVIALDIQPDHVVIEASGVALPDAIASSLSLIQELQLHGTIILADAETIKKQSSDRYVGDTIERQASHADLLILNKIDLLDELEVASTQEWIAQQWPAARLVVVSNAAVPVSLVLDDMPAAKGDTSAKHTGQQNIVQHDASLFTTFTLSFNKNVDANKVATMLACDEFSLARAKGFVTDKHGECKLIQVVGRRWQVSDAPESYDHAKSGNIVCIGISQSLNIDDVRKGLENDAIDSRVSDTSHG